MPRFCPLPRRVQIPSRVNCSVFWRASYPQRVFAASHGRRPGPNNFAHRCFATRSTATLWSPAGYPRWMSLFRCSFSPGTWFQERGSRKTEEEIFAVHNARFLFLPPLFFIFKGWIDDSGKNGLYFSDEIVFSLLRCIREKCSLLNFHCFSSLREIIE